MYDIKRYKCIKYMNKCSNSLIFRKMQIYTVLRSYFSPKTGKHLKNMTTYSVGKSVWKQAPCW